MHVKESGLSISMDAFMPAFDTIQKYVDSVYVNREDREINTNGPKESWLNSH